MFQPEEYQQRIVRLQENINQTGLDAFVVRTDANVIYLTGVDYHSMERPVIMVVPAEGEPALIVPRMEMEQLSAAVTVQQVEVYWEIEAKSGRGWQEALYKILGNAKRVGIEPLVESNMAVALGEYDWTVSPLLEDLRVIKSPAEVDLTRRIAGYWTQIMNAMLAKAKVGVPLSDLLEAAATFVEPVMSKEPQANWINTRFTQFFQCAPASGSPHHFSYRADETLPHGPTVVNSVGAIAHYYAENERTILTGDYSQQHADLFDITCRGHQLALSLIKPGVPCADVDLAVQAYFQSEGLGDCLRHRVGHGFGMQAHERPYTSEGSEEVYRPNMIISVEPGLYMQDVGGFRHSDTVLITEAGIENFTQATPIDRRRLTF